MIYSKFLVMPCCVLCVESAYQPQSIMAAIFNPLSLATFDKSGICGMTISTRMALKWFPVGGGSNVVVNWMRMELSTACQLHYDIAHNLKPELRIVNAECAGS